MARRGGGSFRSVDWRGGLVLGVCVLAMWGCGSGSSRPVQTAAGAASPPVGVASQSSPAAVETPATDASVTTDEVAAAGPAPVNQIGRAHV